MKKTLLLGSLLLLPLATQTEAETRLTVKSQSCGEVKSTIHDEGAVILRWTDPRTGRSHSDRFVAGAPYCDKGFFIRFELIDIAAGVCSLKQCTDASREAERQRQRRPPDGGQPGGGQPGGGQPGGQGGRGVK